MLTLLIILGLIAGAAAAALYLRQTHRSPEMLETQAIAGAENFRPLFEPSKEELLAEQNEKERLLVLETKAEADRQKQLVIDQAELELADWTVSPTRSQTILLLSNAAKSENEDIYLKVC